VALVKAVPKGFYNRFAAWVRLEPRCRRNDFSRGLEAPTADPLWMLIRQIQTGELTAEDAGSPVMVQLTHATQPLQNVRLGQDKDSPQAGLPCTPLETLVEQEMPELSWRDRVQIGQQFERFIRDETENSAEAVVNAYRAELEMKLPDDKEWVDIDRTTRRFLLLATGRVIDGKKLFDKMYSSDPSIHISPLGGITNDVLQKVVSRLDDWCNALNIRPYPMRARAWRNEHLDYRFELNFPDDNPLHTRLVAPNYRNGALDWHSFNTVKDEEDAWTVNEAISVPPKRVSVGGSSMRWWEFEDAATDFGSMNVAKPDLARLLLMEFVLVYGDDWFVVPLKVDMPNLMKINTMTVRNVFKETIPINPARRPGKEPMLRFDLFTLSPASDPVQPGMSDPSMPGSGGFLVIPPIAGYREESPPLEEVRFLRDEGANKVWGVEHRVTNGLGRAVDGFDAQRERYDRQRDARIAQLEKEIMGIEMQIEDSRLSKEQREYLEQEIQVRQGEIHCLREGRAPSSGGIPRYRLATTVPDNWIPFAPFNAKVPQGLDYPCIRLRRAQMLRNDDDEDPTPIPAMSRLLDLNEDPLLWLEEATVSRSGLRVQLTGQRIRWVDGKTYVWKGRKVLTGRGEGSSGLRFDVV